MAITANTLKIQGAMKILDPGSGGAFHMSRVVCCADNCKKSAFPFTPVDGSYRSVKCGSLTVNENRDPRESEPFERRTFTLGNHKYSRGGRLRM